MIESLKNNLGFENAFGVSSIGKAGVSFSQHHICGDIKEENGKQWRFVGVYGWPRQEEKHKTWDLIKHIHSNTTIPLLLGGDFNEILTMAEKEGGAENIRKEMDCFRECLEECRLRDLGYSGHMFTWERGATSSSKVRECLDRYVATIPWCSRFPNFEVTHLARYKSDHCPIVLTAKNHNGKQRRRKNGFKFETCWLLDEECEPLVRRAWGKGEGLEMQQRLEGVAIDLGNKLKWWRKLSRQPKAAQ
ncbi:Pre-mRNA-processing protein 45 [Bienertia sinuspersici]